MRLALLLAVAAASAQPLHQREDQGDQGEQLPTDDTAGTALADATTPTTQPPPDNSSGELPPLLVDVLMQLALDVSRLAMELHRSGGSRTVSAQRLMAKVGEPSLLLTFHRTAEAAEAFQTPEGQVNHIMSLLASSISNANNRQVSSRAMDYESSAEASLAEALPLAIKPLPPPVVPHLVPISMPPDQVEENSSNAVKEVRHEKAQGSHAAGEKQQSKKAGEVAQRSGEVSRTVVTLTSDTEKDDPYGLHFLLRFLEAIHNLVKVVKKLVVNFGGFQKGGTGDSGGGGDGGGGVGGGGGGGGGGGSGDGGGGRNVSSKHPLKNALASTQKLANQMSSLVVAHEFIKAIKSNKQKARGR